MNDQLAPHAHTGMQRQFIECHNQALQERNVHNNIALKLLIFSDFVFVTKRWSSTCNMLKVPQILHQTNSVRPRNLKHHVIFLYCSLYMHHQDKK